MAALYTAGKGGKGPPARTGHSCTVLPDGRLLIFGGVADNGKCVNDMFLIDVKRLTWYKMAAKGAPPKGRAYHSSVSLLLMCPCLKTSPAAITLPIWSQKFEACITTFVWQYCYIGGSVCCSLKAEIDSIPFVQFSS